MRHVAVIDIGKTNAKLVLLDAKSGMQVESLACENTPLAAPPYPHHDLGVLASFILDGLAKLHKNHGVDAISITTHGATAVLMAGDSLALPALDYEFDGPDQFRSDYDAVRPDFAQTLSAKLPNGLNLGAQLFYQQHQCPQEFATVTDILMYPQYWAFLLTGKKVTEVTSLGVHTDLWQPDTADFSALVDAMNWRHLFPPRADARSTLGTITSQIARKTGLAETTPVAVGLHDSNASLLPYLMISDDKVSVVSSGTWTITMSPGASTKDLNEHRDSLANVDMFGRPVPTARFMGGREFEMLMGAQARGEASSKDVQFVLDNDVMVLPGFSGAVGPFPHHAGRWINGPDNLTNGQKLASVSLYLALMTEQTLQLAGCGHQVMVEGPLAKNLLFCQALSVFAGAPVRQSLDQTGTSLGAAMLFDGVGSGALNIGAAVSPLAHMNAKQYQENWSRRIKATSI